MSLQVPHREKQNGAGGHNTKAVILVGGPSRGTRFRPLSLDVPKPLFDIAGHPIIWHCLTAIAKVPDIQEVCMIGYYDETVFRDFIKDATHEFPQLSIKYLREYEALGTAGGLYHFRDAILKGKPERFFVLNADVCCSFPLNDMLKLFEERDAEAVILGTRVSEDAASNFGCIVSDPHSKRVLHYVEKPESHISNLINCGVYLFSTETIFPSIRSAIKRRSDRPRLYSYPGFSPTSSTAACTSSPPRPSSPRSAAPSSAAPTVHACTRTPPPRTSSPRTSTTTRNPRTRSSASSRTSSPT
ncbi:hypothetical protein V491_01807 [Pseudogymnoascus sp. VKM F-3775]|nr:hypothetical protein V491_01807 [Pseudogymnoascus sp. VKM F-3775]